VKPITIIGGGLAGLTLGIGLRQRGIPVTIWEAGHYPRHRVCGEFVSGRGLEVLAQLGLLDSLIRAGAMPAHTAAFFSAKANSPSRPLPMPALCLSGFTMDALLAEHFRRSGGALRENQRWRDNGLGGGLVQANGRRLKRQEHGRRALGLKVHARNVPLASDLEMHLLLNGYVGLCRLKEGEVNVCGLFRRPAADHQTAPPWQKILRGFPGTPLWDRLAGAPFDETSFCSVAGLSLRPQHAAARTDCCIGDALTMIPPVTGNGMSMAFESAALAVEPLRAYAHGQLTWGQAQQAIARDFDRAFASRLKWARWLHRLMFDPAVQKLFASALLRSDWFWRLMFAKTR